ncbi:hypothetical protein Tco_1560135, partial [Tanacetum coccineum]
VVSAQVVAAAKLLVLNPNEFELWKMRIEQYFLMTDYALWEVIVNGDSPPPKRTVDGVEQTYPPTTAKEMLARKNELKERGFGYDWSDQAKEGPINFALMAYTSLGSSSLDTESQLNIGAYKAGLESVKARLDVYKKNKAIFEEDIKILKLDIKLRDNALIELRKKFEKVEKERDDLKLTLETLEIHLRI